MVSAQVRWTASGPVLRRSILTAEAATKGSEFYLCLIRHLPYAGERLLLIPLSRAGRPCVVEVIASRFGAASTRTPLAKCTSAMSDKSGVIDGVIRWID